VVLLVQCLFRSNGSAVLLSNKTADMKRAKYHIRNIVRTNMAADDVAYNCVMQVSGSSPPHTLQQPPLPCKQQPAFSCADN
jgi:hypothetical protein